MNKNVAIHNDIVIPTAFLGIFRPLVNFLGELAGLSLLRLNKPVTDKGEGPFTRIPSAPPLLPVDFCEVANGVENEGDDDDDADLLGLVGVCNMKLLISPG
jgi:hypothetical protein